MGYDARTDSCLAVSTFNRDGQVVSFQSQNLLSVGNQSAAQIQSNWYGIINYDRVCADTRNVQVSSNQFQNLGTDNTVSGQDHMVFCSAHFRIGEGVYRVETRDQNGRYAGWPDQELRFFAQPKALRPSKPASKI